MEIAEEFTAGGFEDIEVTGMVNMVAGGAFGVGDAMRMAENLVMHRAENW